jgi:Glyoxalase/Bleomycin resistance protein/Dioxygenase superfamily
MIREAQMPQEESTIAGWVTPGLHVADVGRSIRFYELLGFELIDIDGKPPVWARMHCEGGALMFLKAEEWVDTSGVPVFFYLYTPDLAGLRDRLAASGIEAPPICYPEYMRSGELKLRNPDGYLVLIGHWGQTEHEAWLKQIEKKKQLRATE